MAVRRTQNPGWKMIDSETVVLSRDKVRDFAAKHNALPRSPTEREFTESRLENLLQVLMNEQAIAFNWATVKYDGRIYRMNGQHSSRAIMNFSGDLPAKLVFHIDRYDAPSRDAMADLFQQFDARWSQRTPADIAGAYQGLDDSLSHCDKNNSRLAIDGVSWYLKHVEGLKVPPGAHVYSLFYDETYHPFIMWMSGFLSSKMPELKPKSVLAAIYATFAHASDVDHVKEFWRDVTFNRPSNENDPIKVLGDVLLVSHEAKKKDDKMDAPEAYVKCIRAWNAHRAGDTVKSLTYVHGKPFPDVSA